MTIPGYDAWKLATPWDDCHEIGTEDGQPCSRVTPPDEDAPRGYRPKPCQGVMIIRGCMSEARIECDTCGETAV